MRANKSSLGLCAAAMVAVALASADSSAQPQPPPETPEPAGEERQHAEYERHLDAGIKLHDAGQYEAAIHEFEAAYAILRDPSPLVNMALCYERLDSPEHPHPTAVPKAIAELERVLTEFGDSLPPERSAAVQAKLAELTPLVGTLTLQVVPPEARVVLGGVELDPAVLRQPVEVRSGLWPVRAELQGYAPTEIEARVTSGTTASVTLTLRPTSGGLVVTPNAKDAYIEVDGKNLQQGTWSGRLPPGTHEVRVFKPGQPARTLRIVVVAGKDHRVTQDATGALESDAPAVGPAAPPVPATKPVAQPEPAPSEPSYTGFHVGAESGILGAVHTQSVDGAFEWEPEHPPVGVVLGVRGGYRPVEWLGFELAAEYHVTWGDGDVTLCTPDRCDESSTRSADYTLTSWRLMGGLRTVLPWDSPVRFVGSAVTGPVFSTVEWDVKWMNEPDPEPHLVEAEGFDFALGLDVGVEFKIDGIVLDLVMQNIFQTNRGIEPKDADESAFDNTFIWFVGPAIRPGYEFF